MLPKTRIAHNLTSVIVVQLDGEYMLRARSSSPVLLRCCGGQGGGFVWAFCKAATMVMSVMATRSSWRELTGVVALLLSTALTSTIAYGQGTEANSSTFPPVPPPNAIFVFGDSYLDTGNHNKSPGVGRPWLPPFGQTYPGNPTGRYSDGRVFTDVLASAFQMISPIPYEQRLSDPNAPRYGMNFAVGGAGVFNPNGMLNLRGQVDQFQSLTNTVYPRVFLQYSMVLVGIHGNDYRAYLAKGNPVSGLPVFCKLVIRELVRQIERLNKLGFKTFYINNAEPAGCLPLSTRPNFSACNELSNLIISTRHNNFLDAAVADLRERFPNATFTILDHFSAFNTVLQDPAKYGLSSEPLVPCCLGAGNGTRSCGDVAPNGQALFTVCKNPAKSFFWDSIHPTQAGWTAVTKVLFPDADLETFLTRQEES